MSKFSFYGRCLFFFLFSAALIAVFLTSIIQGVLIQIQGAFLIALGLYIVAWVCLGTSIILFNKAVRLLKIVNF